MVRPESRAPWAIAKKRVVLGQVRLGEKMAGNAWGKKGRVLLIRNEGRLDEKRNRLLREKTVKLD